MSDFHTHILPNIDDGSGSVEESIELLRMESEQGVPLVMATPHFYARHDQPDRFLEKRAAALDRLRSAMNGDTKLPDIALGAEVHYFPRMSESEILRQLTLNHTEYILVEMPMKEWTPGMYRELENIRVRLGLTPVIAHIDRYLKPFQTGAMFRNLDQLPVLIQANAEFFLNRRTAPRAMKLLKQGKIHLIGSDCHNRSIRTPNLGLAEEAIRLRLDSGALEWIHRHEQMILKGR